MGKTPVSDQGSEGFYVKYCLQSEHERALERKVKRLEKEVDIVRSSTTFRVGRFFMFIPVTIKNWLKKSETLRKIYE